MVLPGERLVARPLDLQHLTAAQLVPRMASDGVDLVDLRVEGVLGTAAHVAPEVEQQLLESTVQDGLANPSVLVQDRPEHLQL